MLLSLDPTQEVEFWEWLTASLEFSLQYTVFLALAFRSAKVVHRGEGGGNGRRGICRRGWECDIITVRLEGQTGTAGKGSQANRTCSVDSEGTGIERLAVPPQRMSSPHGLHHLQGKPSQVIYKAQMNHIQQVKKMALANHKLVCNYYPNAPMPNSTPWLYLKLMVQINEIFVYLEYTKDM